MCSRIFPFAIISLLAISSLGLPTYDNTWRCPSGTHASGYCNSLTFPGTCPRGYQCHLFADDSGLCCPTKIVQPPIGSCPIVTNAACEPMDDLCLSDDVCSQGQRCCSDGCRKVCTKVKSGN